MITTAEQYKAAFNQLCLLTELAWLYRNEPDKDRLALFDGIMRLMDRRSQAWWEKVDHISMNDMLDYILNDRQGMPYNTLCAWEEWQGSPAWIDGYRPVSYGHRDDGFFYYFKDGSFYTDRLKLILRDQLPKQLRDYADMSAIEDKLSEKFSYEDMQHAVGDHMDLCPAEWYDSYKMAYRNMAYAAVKYKGDIDKIISACIQSDDPELIEIHRAKNPTLWDNLSKITLEVIDG